MSLEDTLEPLDAVTDTITVSAADVAAAGVITITVTNNEVFAITGATGTNAAAINVSNKNLFTTGVILTGTWPDNARVVVDGSGTQTTPVQMTLSNLTMLVNNSAAMAPITIRNHGNATLTLDGGNSLTQTYSGANPGHGAINVERGNTVTITGSGKLNAISNNSGVSGGAAIGAAGAHGGYGGSSGNITITGNVMVLAIGAVRAAGIGGGGGGTEVGGDGGVITISGNATVYAYGGSGLGFGNATGIGGGGGVKKGGGSGDITIQDNAFVVAGRSGSNAIDIGAGVTSSLIPGSAGHINILGGTVFLAGNQIYPQPQNALGFVYPLYVPGAYAGGKTVSASGASDFTPGTTITAAQAAFFAENDFTYPAELSAVLWAGSGGWIDGITVEDSGSNFYANMQPEMSPYTAYVDNTTPNWLLDTLPFSDRVTMSIVGDSGSTFESQIVGYGDQSGQAKTLLLKNVGTVDTGILTVSYTGDTADFTTPTTTIANMAVDGTDNNIIITPNMGLATTDPTTPKTYSITVAVSNAVNILAQRTFTFTVLPLITYTAVQSGGSGSATTTGIDVVFSSEVMGIQQGYITVNGAAIDGTIVGDGDTYTIPIHDIAVGNNENISISIARWGDFGIEPGAKNVLVYVVNMDTPAALIDYRAETLTNLVGNASYKFNGGAAVQASAAGTYPIDAAWFGTNVDVVRVGVGGVSDSTAQVRSVPARPGAPGGLAVAPGGISGTTAAMEFSVGGDTGPWEPCTAGMTVFPIGGPYYVRIAATNSSFRSAAAAPLSVTASNHWIDKGNEYQYTTEALTQSGVDDRAPTPVTTYAELTTAMGLVNETGTGGYNVNKPYVILVGNAFNVTAVYTLAGGAGKNIELRSNTPSTNYDLTVSGNFRHFATTGTAKLTLTDVTLAGRLSDGYAFMTDVNDATTFKTTEATNLEGGGIQVSGNFTFKGDIKNCIRDDSSGPAIDFRGDNSHLSITGGKIHHNGSSSWNGAIGSVSGGNPTNAGIDLSGDTEIYDNWTKGEGGGIIFGRNGASTSNIRDNVKIHDNHASMGAGIEMFGNGSVLNIYDNVQIVDNVCYAKPNRTSIVYEGTGGGILLSGFHYPPGTITGTQTVNIYDNVLISGNVASRGGGGIYVDNTNNNSAVNLYGGTITGNSATGTSRELAAGAPEYDKTAIGSGGGVFAYKPQNIYIPANSTVSFSGNSAAFAGRTDVTTYTPWVTGENYSDHILKDFGQNTSTGFEAPYDNLYNNYDIGIPNSAAQGIFAEIELTTFPSFGGSILQSAEQLAGYTDVFGDSGFWKELNQGDGLTFEAEPADGFVFDHWGYDSDPALVLREWVAAFDGNYTDDGSANTFLAGVKAHATIGKFVMPNVSTSLVANFNTAASLNRADDHVFEAEFNGGYSQPAAWAVGAGSSGLTNSGQTEAANVHINITDVKLDGVPYGSAVFTWNTGSVSIAAGTADTSLWVQPVAGLSQGAYTATLTLTYEDGSGKTVTKKSEIGFALFGDEPMILTISSNFDFGTVVAGYSPPSEDVRIYNYGNDNAGITDIEITGASADAFVLTPDNHPSPNTATIPGRSNNGGNPGLDDSTWTVSPVGGLLSGVYNAKLVVYYGSGKTASKDIYLKVTGSANLSATGLTFAALKQGYSTPPNYQPVVIHNSGDIQATNLTITSDKGAGSVYTLNGNNPVVSASGTNSSYLIAPKAGVLPGNNLETFTITYDDGSGGAPQQTTFTVQFTVIEVGAPTGEISVGTNMWNLFWNTITFGLFAKNTQRVTIDYTGDHDLDPNIQISYYLSPRELSETEVKGAIPGWTLYGTGTIQASVDINPNNKYFVYARIEDTGSGKTVYLNTAGIVAYTDSSQTGQDKNIMRPAIVSGAIINDIAVTLNGNTIAGIVNTTKGGQALAAPTDYSESSGVITLTNSYLRTLAGSETGTTYTFTVSYNPLGVAYPASPLAGSEAPATTTFTVTVSKANQTPALVIDSLGSHTYGSTYPITSSGGEPLATGTVSYEIVSAGSTGAGSIAGDALTITKAGTIVLKATKAADDNYNSIESAEFPLTVNKANQTALSLTGLGSSYTYGDAPVTNVSTTGGTTTGNVIYETTPVSGGAGSIVANDGAGTSATLTIAAPGTFTVTATKAGDTGYNEANVTSGSIKVNKAVPGVTVSASGGAIFGQDVSIEATVTKVGTGVVPTGSVDIYLDSGSTPVATNVTLNVQGKATYNLGALSGGPHTIEVRYSGNAYYKGNGATDNDDTTITGALGSTTHSVGLATDSISIADPGAKTYGDANFTIALGAAGAGTGANGGLGNGTGAVTWASSDLLVATVNANTGLVTITGRGAGGNGTTTITATKAADVNYNGTSATFSLTVAKATPSWNLVPTATALTYGNFLSASTLSGEVVKGAGTDSGTTRTGSVTWTAPGTVPDVTGINTANDKYGVTWTPSGGDAYLYNAITTDDVILTVNKATPVRYTDLSATPIAIFSEAGETLANSDITGGNVRYMRGSVWTDVPGDLATGWRWDTPGKSYATTGNNNEPVTFTPADPLRFNGITDTADIVVFSPKTRITMPPTASGIIYGSAVGSSALDDTLAEAIAVGVGAAPPNGTPITGTWTWSSPSVSATATGTISAEVKFIPTNLATPNPSDPPGGYLPATGYIPSTVMVNIAVAKADPAEDVIAPIGMGSGESLSSVPLISYNFTGAFGENVDGILTWKYPSVKPSDFLPGGIGIYPTVVVFTPTGTFADNYKVVEVPISVNVIVSKQPLIDLRDQIETLLGLIAVDIHAENYLAGAVTALQNALTAANIVIADVSATQTDVNDALEALQRAYGAMLHDHPVEAHSHRNGVTSPGQTVTIKIKGYFADVTSIKLGGTTYTLGPVDHGGPAPTRAILHGSATVGQIAEGSAVVTFYAAAIDALANGTYPLVVTFVDNIGTGYSVSSAVANSEILVNRPGDEDDDDEDDDDEDDDDEDDGDEDEDEDIGADEGGGAGSNARTGDNMNLLLWFALAMAAVIALLILRRLRRTDKN